MADIFKTKKREKTILTVLVTMFCITILMLIVATTAYFSHSGQASGQITLGELDFCIFENDQSFLNVVPSQSIQKVVIISNSRDSNGQNTSNLCPILFKFSVGCYVDDTYDSSLSQLIVPQFANNERYTFYSGEYYYNGVLSPGQNVNLCDTLNFLEDIGDQYQSSSVEIVFSIDAIQAENNAYTELWQDAPQNWVQVIQNIA